MPGSGVVQAGLIVRKCQSQAKHRYGIFRVRLSPVSFMVAGLHLDLLVHLKEGLEALAGNESLPESSRERPHHI